MGSSRIWVVTNAAVDPAHDRGTIYAREQDADEATGSDPELVVTCYVRERENRARASIAEAIERLLEAYPNASITISRAASGDTNQAVVMLKDATRSLQRGDSSGDVGHAILKLYERFADEARKNVDEAEEHARKLGLEDE